MARVVNAYTVSPNDIQVGDVMFFVVKAMVVREGAYRIYCCAYDRDLPPEIPPWLEHNLPQGSRILTDERTVCKALFPSLAAVAKPDTL